LKGLRPEPLLAKVVDAGARLRPSEETAVIAAFARGRLAALPAEHKRFENPHTYKVGLSDRLAGLRDDLVRRFRKED
jgi:nicotinate phosphoribosyltransferase